MWLCSVSGIDISQSALSALEGQTRKVTDKELLALTDILKVSLEELFHPPGVEEKR